MISRFRASRLLPELREVYGLALPPRRGRHDTPSPGRSPITVC